MSEAAVSQFFEKLKNDPALAGDYNTALANAILPAMVEVAARHGFEFTPQEVGHYLKKKSHELDDQELEAIAGGRGPAPHGARTPSRRPSLLTNPWVVGACIAVTVVTPLATSDEDDGA